MPRAGAFLALLLTFVVSTVTAQAGAEMQLQLEVILNRRPLKLVAAFTLLADGRMTSTFNELREIGLDPPRPENPDALFVLDSIPGVTYTYLPKTQVIEITAAASTLQGHSFDASGRGGFSAPSQVSNGVVVNYSLLGSASTRADGSGLALDGGSLSLDSRAFGPLGTFSSSGIVRQFNGVGEDFLPLDFGWSYADPESLRLWRAGDFISGGLPWTRPIRMAGLQLQRSFSLRPDLITQPLPAFSGSAVVPSTVDVYVGNTKTYSQDVPAGPFEISNIPIVSSSGTARIVVRDSSGHETDTAAPFITATDLLRAGFYDYSAEIGFARRDYGISAFNYSDLPIASLTGRYGFSDQMTLESHGEFGPGLANVGLGAACEFMNLMHVSGAVSTSIQGHDFGAQAYAAFDTRIAGVDVQLSSHQSLGDYADLGTVTVERQNAYTSFGNPLSQFYGAKPPREIDQLSIGLPLRFDDSRLGFALLHLVNDEHELSSDIITASYSRPLTNDISLFATTFAGLDNNDRYDFGLYVGLTKTLGSGGSLTATVSSNRDGIGYGVEYAKPLEQKPGSFGWQTRIIEGDGAEQQAAVAYRGEWTETQARVTRIGNYATGTAEVAGALVASGGSVFFANRIDDSFAVVDVGAPGVNVMLDNRQVAVSGSDGRALVTNLRSYETANISIDPTNLPLNSVVAAPSTTVTPANGGGVNVKMDVRATDDAALLVLRDAHGAPLPVGSQGRLAGGTIDFVIGYGGEAYVSGLSSFNSAVVTYPDGECHASFAFAPQSGTQPVIDPVVCR